MTTVVPAGSEPRAPSSPPDYDWEAGNARGSDQGDGDRGRARAVAEAVLRSAVSAGAPVDGRLRIWSLAGLLPPPALPGDVGPPGIGAGADAAALLGQALEAATSRDDRRALGLHVTPTWLADRLVALSLPEPRPAEVDGTTVCDPACGGGAFLVASARRLAQLGADRRRVVRELLWGADVDPVGLAAAEAALALWAGEPPPPGRLVVADPLRSGPVVWPDPPPGGFGAVVGNPPFRTPLARATAPDAAERERLRLRFGAAAQAYTDTAWLFLLLGCELVRPGGRVVLVEPQSLVSARDATAVRDGVDRLADLESLWLDDGPVFSAAVRVCAPVLRRRPADPQSDDAPPSGAGPDGGGWAGGGEPSGPDGDGAGESGHDGRSGRRGRRRASSSWTDAWADAVGLPVVDLGCGSTVGECAAVLAGFRDEYYGLVDAVRERAVEPPDADVGSPLVTSGSVDWAACAWGRRPTRYAKRRWREPVVDPERLAGATAGARRWVERTRAPKLVVASQTRVIEAAVDVDGTWVPSVPALAVIPTAGPAADPAVDVAPAGGPVRPAFPNGVAPTDGRPGLWHLAAALLSPAATAWLARRAAGSGLEPGALKVAAPDLAALPLPGDRHAWDASAAALAAFVAARTESNLARYLDSVRGAYGTPAGLDRWWRHRAGTVVHVGAPEG